MLSLWHISWNIERGKKNFSWSGSVFFNTILKTLDSNRYHRWFDCLHCLFQSHVVSIFSEANTWIKLLMAYLCIVPSKWNFPALFHLILLLSRHHHHILSARWFTLAILFMCISLNFTIWKISVCPEWNVLVYFSFVHFCSFDKQNITLFIFDTIFYIQYQCRWNCFYRNT